MKVQRTARGFDFIEFKDANEEDCSIQQSSATRGIRDPGGDLIWLGVTNAAPTILASRAAEAGILTDQTTGWIDVPLPEGACTASRMHLDIDQAKEVVRHLQRWIRTGSLQRKRSTTNETSKL